MTADELMAVVRVHADRVHDAVRRLGCTPDVAIRVVQASALDLLDAVAHRSQDVGDGIGWWYARARSLARNAAGGDEHLPVGGGLLSSDASQVRLAEALEARPERERAALLLRDSYDLPASAVGGALNLDQESAMEVVGQARLALLSTPSEAHPQQDHPSHLAPLARVAEGGQTAAREGATRRHVSSCETCSAIVAAQERARRLLSGLTIVAMPDTDRDALIARVDSRARSLLPATPQGAPEVEWEDEPYRRYSLSLMALGLVLAAGVGVGVGALMSRGTPGGAVADQRPLPLVTPAAVIVVGPTQTSRPPTATSSPSPRVFAVTPSPTPTPTSASPTPDPSSTGTPASMQLTPSSGPRGTSITVTGRGFTPGSTVQLDFHNAGFGQGSSSQATVATDGTFTGTLQVPSTGNTLPGPHRVTADDGEHSAEATFTVT